MKDKKGDNMDGNITTENVITQFILNSLRASFNDRQAVRLVDDTSDSPSIRVTIDNDVYAVSVTKCVFD